MAKRWLLAGAVVVVLAGLIAGWEHKHIALFWAKSRASREIAKLGPTIVKNLNATPAREVLPPSTNLPVDVEQVGNFALSFPVPDAKRRTKGDGLILNYPQFEVMILRPFSTRNLDARLCTLSGKDLFQHNCDVYMARPMDIDTQPDAASLKNLVGLLSEKVNTAAYATYFIKFENSDRKGFIIAMDEQKHDLLCELNFPTAAGACGVHFERRDAGVPVGDMLRYVASMNLEFRPVSTTESAPATVRTTMPAR